MNQIHHSKVSEFLSCIDINQLSSHTGFALRKPQKITAELFIVSFFNVMLKKCYSLRQWAIELSFLSGNSVSFQAIAKKLQFRQLAFVKALFLRGLELQLAQHNYWQPKIRNTFFNRILIEDSTCIKLPSALSEYFPGSRNQHGDRKAIARIQLSLDLLTDSFKAVSLKSYCDHDTKYSSQILGYIKQGDLILRDMGYSIIKVFRAITKIKAYYISRLHPNWTVLDADNESVINLHKELKMLDKQNITLFDRVVKVGNSEKLTVRIVCLKLSHIQAQIRRSKARRNGNRNRKSSPKTSYLLGWNILITNIKKDQIKAYELYKYYSLRWHIEMIFKNWKSHFKIDDIFRSCQGRNYAKPEFLLYLCMCFLVLIYNPKFRYFQRIIYQKTGRFLSPAKFAKLTANHIEFLFLKETDYSTELMSKNCCYAIRKDRQNIYERILYI